MTARSDARKAREEAALTLAPGDRVSLTYIGGLGTVVAKASMVPDNCVKVVWDHLPHQIAMVGASELVRYTR